MHFLLWTAVGLFAGWMTGKNLRGYGYGPLIDAFMGVAGALVGGFTMRFAGFSGTAGMVYATLVAALCAVAMAAAVAFASGRQRYA